MSGKIILTYNRDQSFEFTVKETASMLKGHFKKDKEIKNNLRVIVQSEESTWYVNERGDRLPWKQLFEKSKWEIREEDNHQKVLLRFLDISTGEAWFSTQEQYSETE